MGWAHLPIQETLQTLILMTFQKVHLIYTLQMQEQMQGFLQQPQMIYLKVLVILYYTTARVQALSINNVVEDTSEHNLGATLI